MILKTYIVEQDLKILKNYRSVLLYGENDGIKDDIKSKIKHTHKEAEIINFFEDEILKNKNLLYENINNGSLFNEKKIIFIQSATDKILEEIIYGLQKENDDTKIYIFCDNLDKKSKLRSFFEKEKNLATLPCYTDNEQTLINYVTIGLKGLKGLTGEIINIIINNSGSNRKIIKNELIKIRDFFEKKTINKEQLLEILNIRNDNGFNEIRDQVLIGRKAKVNKLLSEVDLTSEDSFFYLNSFYYRILKLAEISKENMKYNNLEETLDNIRPAVFWKDKPTYLQQIARWDLQKLNNALHKVGEVEILMKKNSHIRKDILIKNLIVSLLDEANITS